MQNLKKSLFWKPRRRWENNIKMKLNEPDVRVCTGFLWFTGWLRKDKVTPRHAYAGTDLRQKLSSHPLTNSVLRLGACFICASLYNFQQYRSRLKKPRTSTSAYTEINTIIISSKNINEHSSLLACDAVSIGIDERFLGLYYLQLRGYVVQSAETSITTNRHGQHPRRLESSAIQVWEPETSHRTGLFSFSTLSNLNIPFNQVPRYKVCGVLPPRLTFIFTA